MLCSMMGMRLGKMVHNSGIQNVENLNGLSVVLEIANQYGNGNGLYKLRLRKWSWYQWKRDAAYLQQQLQIAQEEEARIQSTQLECKSRPAADAYKK
ncbi:hypothetical protein Tco_0322619 [Tanacetum coccineum]